MISKLIKWVIPLILFAIVVAIMQYIAMHIFHWNFLDSLLQGIKEIIKAILEWMK